MTTTQIINLNEAREEADRLSRVLKRDVEVKTRDCGCNYDKSCGTCGGQGYTYILVYAFCDHEVGDVDDLGCEAADCAHREYLAFCVREEELEAVR